jgi:hypothetical protein
LRHGKQNIHKICGLMVLQKQALNNKPGAGKFHPGFATKKI